MISFIRNIPKTREGQINWIIKKAQERYGKGGVCTDSLKDFTLCDSIEGLYKKVQEVVEDSLYYDGEI